MSLHLYYKLLNAPENLFIGKFYPSLYSYFHCMKSHLVRYYQNMERLRKFYTQTFAFQTVGFLMSIKFFILGNYSLIFILEDLCLQLLHPEKNPLITAGFEPVNLGFHGNLATLFTWVFSLTYIKELTMNMCIYYIQYSRYILFFQISRHANRIHIQCIKVHKKQ